MMPISPEEHDEIAGYIFHNYHHLLNSDEKDAFDIVIIEGRNCVNQRASKLLENGEPLVYDNVVERILKENKDEVVFNKCPVCGNLCRTPLAKQCRNPECFHDWHN